MDCNLNDFPDYCSFESSNSDSISGTTNTSSNEWQAVQSAIRCGANSTSASDKSMDISNINGAFPTSPSFQGNISDGWDAGYAWNAQNPNKPRPRKPL
jgi:hypothetical protein